MAQTCSPSSAGKILRALSYGVARPRELAKLMQRGLAGLYQRSVLGRSPIPTVLLSQLVDPSVVSNLADCQPRDGNVSLQEVLAISALVRQQQPSTLVEIGTFDGNTALQMALNSPAHAVVYTLDLPLSEAKHALDPKDGAYITDQTKLTRKYARSAVANKVVQWLGDSATFDFAAALGGRLVDLAFIDGSHSYDYVRSDTERLLPLLSPQAIVAWHDYATAWPGVMEYLNQRCAQERLVRVEGTSLVLRLPPGGK